MTRLKKELLKRGILFEADEMDVIMKGVEYDCSASLVEITSEFIITVMYSAVLDPVLYIYDRFTFKPIGEQELHKDTQTDGGFDWFNPWHSMVYEREA